MSPLQLVASIFIALTLDRIVTSMVAVIVNARRTNRARARLRAIGESWGVDVDYGFKVDRVQEFHHGGLWKGKAN